ncbi:MAG: HlyD family efflux transporter periplasmic adaptor subunit [Bacteroidetes bacterium]|nr:HlyD family efflux transporter periplasmic adaptor subunit [Bacteroidota bacterium]
MANEKDELNLRSEEIQDIMQKTPAWILRWGISSIFILLILGLFLTYLIEYPDIIKGPVKITTTDPPVKIVCQVAGNITHIYVKDGDSVQAGTVLAEIENPVSGEAVSYLKSYLESLDKAVGAGSPVLPLPDTSGLAFGDLRATLNELTREIVTLNLRKSTGIDDRDISTLMARIRHEQELLNINDKMLSMAQKDLENARIKYESDKALYEQGVLSKTDFLAQENTYRNRQLQVEQMQQSRLNNSIALSGLQQQYQQSDFNRLSKDRTGYEAVKLQSEALRSFLFGWQQRYRLTSPKNGRVSFMVHLQPRMFVKPGEELIAILAPKGEYLGLASVPVAGIGKVKTGQKVLILLESFPYYEYGMVEGKVKTVAELPNGNEYRVEVALPNGMMSTHNEVLKFSPEMLGTVEIVTEDKRVIERIFSSLVKIFKKR